MAKATASLALAVTIIAASAQAECALPANGDARLIRPVAAEFRPTLGFELRTHPLLQILRLHPGVDFVGPIGTPIKAAAAGEVAQSARHGEYGNYIRIRHVNGLETEYAHLQKFAPDISPGKCLSQGDIIGFVGTTGLSTGPHLHFGVLASGRNVDPVNYIDGLAAELAARPKDQSP